MDWKKTYEERKCSADDAVRKGIKSGDRVVFAHCVGEPPVLVDAMVKNKDAYKDVTVSHMVTLGKGEYSLPENHDSFTFEGWFLSPTTRKSTSQGHGEFVPVFFHEIPKLIRQDIFHEDVLLVSVSKPDEHGFCCTGVSSDYTMQAAKSCKTVIAEVNDQMPTVFGDTFIHVNDIDYFVETSHPLYEITPPTIGPVEEAIGKNCASLIKDGDTLQLGIGAIPDAVLSQLGDKKHLGIHSEMISDGVVDLYEKGAIDCSMNPVDNGKMVITFLMGTKRLYDFCDKNPMVELRPVDYVNHPEVVAQCSNIICINSCVQVDFMGQIVSECIGTNQISAVGGQVDFVRGAAMSHDGNGKAIIAMPSVTVKKDGTKISKIVPFIDHGAAVTTSRCDADYVITEYGIAEMKGKTLHDRARQLINIAHPDVREELKKQFVERFNCEF
ncbi:MAG: acetyl-CoA hydrolase/transferase C-terminal domain-containing protein [Eubacteriaceae bacterium]|nr:acetyl-CoA hydrolase/transferase C-terminal domain-containing protein [Eubacteriaceae bacterium]